MSKALVIGSGIGGIATAIRLASQGIDVTVAEKNHQPGGKLGQININGFRFDTGPSLFTMPHLIAQLFELTGKKSSDYLQLKQLDVICRYFYPDGLVMDSASDPELFARHASTLTGEPEKNILSYLHHCKKLYDVAAPVFIFNSLHKFRNYLKPEFLKAFFRLHEFDFFNTLHSRNNKSFHSQHLIQLFDRYATYNGSDPYQTPATLKIISHLEHNIGAYFPLKGMYSVAQSLYQLACEMGVKFRFNTTVSYLAANNRKAEYALTSDGEKIAADFFISDCDIFSFYKQVLPNHKIPFLVSHAPRSSSAVIYYWGINTDLQQLQLHNILFSADYKTEFQAIFRKKTIYHDPTVYIFISSKLVRSDAPAGKSNWFVMINAPENCRQNWEKLRREARSNIIKKINKMLHIDIEKMIECETVADPVSIEQQTLSAAGSLYGTSSNSKLSAFMRHPNFTGKIRNLYFTGGSVHPGGGIPLCLASAEIVSNLIKAQKR